MQKVRWGILSTAKIGVNKVIPAMQKSDLIEVAAIASRSEESAREAAQKLGIAKVYGSYEALIADPDIDAIYNPLPNHLHVPLTLAAAHAGKHVLCEKPMAMNAAEIDQLSEAAKNVHIMEAFMVRHSSQWLEARDKIREGAIGAPQAVQVYFTYNNRDPNNIRNKVEWGGGGLMDIGCYAIVAGRFFFEADPVRAIALIERHPEFKTDVVASSVLDFGGGRQLSFSVSTQLSGSQAVHVFGPDGHLTIPIPFNSLVDAPNHFTIYDGQRAPDGKLPGLAVYQQAVADQYTQMSETFSRAVRGEIALPYGIDDARINMRIIDALFRSETSGKWETI